MYEVKALVLMVVVEVLLNCDGGCGKEDCCPRGGMIYIHFLPSVAILHAASAIPALGVLCANTEGALGGTLYLQDIADLRREEEQPHLALSCSRGMHG